MRLLHELSFLVNDGVEVETINDAVRRMTVDPHGYGQRFAYLTERQAEHVLTAHQYALTIVFDSNKYELSDQQAVVDRLQDLFLARYELLQVGTTDFTPFDRVVNDAFTALDDIMLELCAEVRRHKLEASRS